MAQAVLVELSSKDRDYLACENTSLSARNWLIYEVPNCGHPSRDSSTMWIFCPRAAQVQANGRLYLRSYLCLTLVPYLPWIPYSFTEFCWIAVTQETPCSLSQDLCWGTLFHKSSNKDFSRWSFFLPPKPFPFPWLQHSLFPPGFLLRYMWSWCAVNRPCLTTSALWLTGPVTSAGRDLRPKEDQSEYSLEWPADTGRDLLEASLFQAVWRMSICHRRQWGQYTEGGKAGRWKEGRNGSDIL